MRATLNLIIKVITVLIIISLIPILIMTAIMFSAYEKGPLVPTDTEMIEHFQLHETLFEELRTMIEYDSLRSFPLSVHEKKEGKILPISVDRESKYDSLMKKTQIIRFWYSNPFQKAKENSILFFYFEKGDATWGIEKGFEYVFDRAEEEDKEFMEIELYDSVIEKYKNNCFLYKKINDKWNLFIFYDR